MLFSNIVILYSVYLAAKAAIEVPNAPPPMIPTFKEVSISVEKSFHSHQQSPNYLAQVAYNDV